jgi:two-component system, OmpR family, response regulator
VLIVEDRQELAGLIAAALQHAGFEAEVAHLARDARRKIAASPPDAVILELLLPDDFGFDVAKRVRAARPEAAVIALSGAFREDPAVREALRTGLLDAFLEKPFRVAQVVATLRARLGLEEGDDDDAREPGASDDPARDLAARTVEGNTGDFSFDVPEGGLAAAVAQTAEAFSTDEIPELLVGDLSERSLPRLINAFYLGSQSGELTLVCGRVVKMIFFQDGRPVFAASNVQGDRFDERLLAGGAVEPAAIAAATAEAERSGKRIDRVLLEMGVLTPSEHRRQLTEQIKAIVFSLFAWTEGHWRISFEDRAADEPVRLQVFPAELILEGVTSLPLQTLRTLLSPTVRLVPAPAPAYELYELPLSGDQAMIVARLDGTRSVADVVEEGWLPEQATHALLYGLRCLEVVEDASLLIL